MERGVSFCPVKYASNSKHYRIHVSLGRCGVGEQYDFCQTPGRLHEHGSISQVVEQ